MVSNFSEQTVVLQKSAVLGVAELTTVNQIDECNSIAASGSSPDEDSLKSSLRLAHRVARKNILKSHEHNKKYYDRKSTVRNFEAGEVVYLYNPAKKAQGPRKFSHPWAGPFKVASKLPNELTYKIVNPLGKESIVHINRLKKAFNQLVWEQHSQDSGKSQKRQRKPEKARLEETEETLLSPGPIVAHEQQTHKHQPQADSPTVNSPRELDTPELQPRDDPSYRPPISPKSRRELRSTREEPPVTRSKTRVEPPVTRSKSRSRQN
jgi:hypothetical protein